VERGGGISMDALASMIALLETPIAKRKGVFISPEDCKIWAEELTNLQLKFYQDKHG
jgi:hypothetical protein